MTFLYFNTLLLAALALSYADVKEISNKYLPPSSNSISNENINRSFDEMESSKIVNNELPEQRPTETQDPFPGPFIPSAGGPFPGQLGFPPQNTLGGFPGAVNNFIPNNLPNFPQQGNFIPNNVPNFAQQAILQGFPNSFPQNSFGAIPQQQPPFQPFGNQGFPTGGAFPASGGFPISGGFQTPGGFPGAGGFPTASFPPLGAPTGFQNNGFPGQGFPQGFMGPPFGLQQPGLGFFPNDMRQSDTTDNIETTATVYGSNGGYVYEKPSTIN